MNRYAFTSTYQRPLMSWHRRWNVKAEFKKRMADYIVLRNIIESEHRQYPKEEMWWCDICNGDGTGTTMGQVKTTDIYKYYKCSNE